MLRENSLKHLFPFLAWFNKDHFHSKSIFANFKNSKNKISENLISEYFRIRKFSKIVDLYLKRDFYHFGALRYAPTQFYCSSILIYVQRSKPEFREIKIIGWSFWTLCKKVIKFKKSRNRWRLFRVQIHVKICCHLIGQLVIHKSDAPYVIFAFFANKTRISGYFRAKNALWWEKSLFLI